MNTIISHTPTPEYYEGWARIFGNQDTNFPKPFDPTDHTIIFDLDGTLADNRHRDNLIEGDNKRWDKYFEMCFKDEPYKDVIQMCNLFYEIGFHVVILSGRSDRVKDKTVAWLEQNKVSYSELHMRKDSDHRPDTIVKKQIMDRHFNNVKIFAIFDDRDCVVKMWRDNGYRCYQVNYGNF